jgi:hypothetical protein
VIAGASTAISAAPDEPQRAVSEPLSFDRRSTARFDDSGLRGFLTAVVTA